MGERAKILLIDDDPVDRSAVRRGLEAGGLDAALDEVSTVAAAEAKVAGPEAHAYDCLIIAEALPDGRGLDLIARVRAGDRATPIVALIAGDEDVGAALIDAGATDYLPRGDLVPARLVRRVRYAMRVAQAETSARDAASALAQSLEARDDLLAIVSHDLRNPLNAVGIAIDELADGGIDETTRARCAALVRRALKRADRLIRDLLDANQIEGGRLILQLARVQPRTLIEQAFRDHEALARDAGSTLSFDVAETLPAVRVDAERIQQLFGNLIGNALRHARGAPITLTARVVEGGVAFVVADGGPGLRADTLPHLFDRYWKGHRPRRSGSGLGLAIARGLAEAHGGSLVGATRPEGGAAFTLVLPMHP